MKQFQVKEKNFTLQIERTGRKKIVNKREVGRIDQQNKRNLLDRASKPNIILLAGKHLLSAVIGSSQKIR